MAIEFLDDVTVKASALKLTSGVSDKPILTIECTNAIAGTEPDLVFFKNSASSAEADIGAIRFHSQTSVGGEEEYASILGEIVIDTDAAIQGSLSLFVKANNLRKAGITIVGGSTTNEVNTYIGSPVSGQAPGILRISDGSTNSVGFKTPAALGADTLYVLPSSDGTNNQVLSTDGSANLSWATGGGSNTNIANTNLTLDAARTTSISSYSLLITSGSGNVINLTSSSVSIFNGLYLRTDSATTAPEIRFSAGTSANYVAVKAPDTVASSYTLTLPAADGSSNQVIQTDGSGLTSWADNNIGSANLAIAGTSTVRTLTLSSGNGSSYSIESSTNAPYVLYKKGVTDVYKKLRIQPDSANGAILQLYEGTGGTGSWVGFKSPSTVTDSIDYTLPAAPPASDKVLQSTSAGIMSWVDADTNIGTNNITIDDTVRSLNLNAAGGGSSIFKIMRSNATDLLAKFQEGSIYLNDPVTIRSNAAVPGVVYIYDSDDTNYIGLKAPANVVINVTYTLPAVPTVNGQILAGQTDGTMYWASSAPTPTLIMGSGGRVTIYTSTDDSARFIVLGSVSGFNSGTNYWTTALYAGTPGFTGLGSTVTTISTTTVTPVLGNQGAFQTIVDGKVRLQGAITGTNNTDNEGADIYIYIFKVPDSIVTAMGDGGAQADTDYELVASALCTLPSTSVDTRPTSFESTNGVVIDAGDWVFAAMAFADGVDGTRYFKINFNVYVEPYSGA